MRIGTDLTGQRFGQWLVLRHGVGVNDFWLCRCSCGTRREVRGANLRIGVSNSCGCTRTVWIAELNRRHYVKYGPARPVEREKWRGAIGRCYNSANPEYKNYGGRGIGMCKRWRSSFQAFYKDMGPCPKGLTLDRFPDPNGNYEPGNCRWATWGEQSRNTRQNVWLVANGERKILVDWAKFLGVKSDWLRYRVVNKKIPLTRIINELSCVVKV